MQIHYWLKNDILKKSFIQNMDPEEELAVAVVVYILGKKKKKCGRIYKIFKNTSLFV